MAGVVFSGLVMAALASQPRHVSAQDRVGPEGADGGVARVVRLALSTGSSRPTADQLAARLHALIKKTPTLASRLPGHEQLAAVDRDGEIVICLDGSETDVPPDAVLENLFADAGAQVIVVHNHPHGRSFSVNDLALLGKPGVAGLIAIGQDGGVYAATTGLAYGSFERDLYPSVKREVIRHLSADLLRFHATPGQFDRDIEHIIATTLDKADVIHYWGFLPASRAQSLSRFHLLLHLVTESVGARVRQQRRDVARMKRE